MNFVRYVFPATILGLCLLSDPVRAERLGPGDTAPDAGQLHLAHAFVKAVRAKNLGTLRSLHHSQSFECITEGNRRFVDENLDSLLSNEIPAEFEAGVSSIDHSITDADLEVIKLPPDEARKKLEDLRAAFARLATSSVEATHKLVVRWSPGAGKLKSIYLPIVEENDRWFLVQHCLTEEGIRWKRDIQHNKSRDTASVPASEGGELK